MNWEAVAATAESIGAIGVIVTLAYLARQVSSPTSALGSQARITISDLSFKISTFRAEHAGRYAKLASGENLTAGDLEFPRWSHFPMMVHGETYFYHYEVGLMPERDWLSYGHFVDGYIDSAEFREFWTDTGSSFNPGFTAWINQKIQQRWSAPEPPAV